MIPFSEKTTEEKQNSATIMISVPKKEQFSNEVEIARRIN